MDLCGDKQVPSLKVGEEMIRGSAGINRYLVDEFLD